AHPHGEDGGEDAEGGEDAAGCFCDAGKAEKREGEATIETVLLHCLSEEEAAEEEEADGVAEVCEDGGVFGDAEDDAECGSEESGGGHGDCLRDPQDNRQAENRCQGVCLVREGQ